jgi:hypothetical protein
MRIWGKRISAMLRVHKSLRKRTLGRRSDMFLSPLGSRFQEVRTGRILLERLKKTSSGNEPVGHDRTESREKGEPVLLKWVPSCSEEMILRWEKVKKW